MSHKVSQKYLKSGGLIALITVMNMAAPLSIDMYLPAVPHMTEYFATSAATVNLTLVGFYFFMAIGILIFGPLSDKYGRKPLLLVGLSFYLVFSGCCAIAGSIYQLIAFRMLQALGAGCMMAVSTAMVKDSFDGKVRDKVLAIVQAMAVIAPMVAPLIGAFILSFATWRATFWVLVGIAALCLLTAFLMEETLSKSERYQGSFIHSLGRLIVVGKNKGFLTFLLMAASLSAPYMAYIAVCSYIYVDFFQLSETAYSIFFAINSAAAVAGPMIYIRINGKVSNKNIVAACLLLTLFSSALLLSIGRFTPLLFLLAFLPFTVTESALRPFSTAILLNQQEHDTGSASALINFTHTVFGSIGMLLGTLRWGNFITGLGIILLISVAIAALIWLLLLQSKAPVIGINDQKQDSKSVTIQAENTNN